MTSLASGTVREILLEHLSEGLHSKGVSIDAVSDETDFFAEQLIDSFGLLELFLALEERFGVTIDFDAADAESLTRVGPFCSYVEALSRL